MRRFIAVFSLSIFIFIHFLSFQPVSAISSVDYGEMLNTYLGAAETALAASQGVTIDWSDLELPAGSDTWTDHQKAEYVVSYLGNMKRVGQHAIYEWLFGEDNDTFDVISAETAAISLSKNSNIDTQDIKAQLDNILATQSQDHVFQRYTDKVIARWNEYNTNYINDYLTTINYNPDAIETFSPAEYLTKVDKIVKFYYVLNNVQYDLLTLPLYTQTNTWDVWDNRLSYSYVISQNNQYYCAIDKVHFLLNGSDNSWTLNVSSPITPHYDVFGNKPSYNPNVDYYRSIKPYSITNNVLRLDFASNNIKSQNTTFPYTFNSIDGALNWINSNYFCCNLSVNGQLWGYSGEVIDNGITVSVPDAVIDNSTDDGKIVAHPIYYPDTMNTDKALNIDLDKVIDAIASRIAQGADDITFDDLVDAGAAVKLDGTTLTDADTIVKDVSVPIARAKVDTIDGVIPTIDVVPPLPPLPPINQGDFSGEGFSGMSVLARIINATVQGLPEPLILTFFGVVFGAVILGIIKILHH